MTRDQAVQRINQAIGFRPAGNNLEGTIVLMLQEAQRDLEKGKSLPRFMLQENQTLSLTAGTHSVALPTGFIRESDENTLSFFPSTSAVPRYLSRRYYKDAVEATTRNIAGSELPEEPVAPTIYVIRRSIIDFITTSDRTYTLQWDYWKQEPILEGGTQSNGWLTNAPEWLWGEAGWRLAQDLVFNPELVAKFDRIRQAGRASFFAEEIAAELSSGPLQMGANL